MDDGIYFLSDALEKWGLSIPKPLGRSFAGSHVEVGACGVSVRQELVGAAAGSSSVTPPTYVSIAP